MKTPITPVLIRFFADHGYSYWLSKRSLSIVDKPAPVTLIPVRRKPGLKEMYKYDACHYGTDTPMQLAANLDGPMVMVELSNDLLARFVSFLFNSRHRKDQA